MKSDAQKFASEVVDEATGIRVRVEIVVPEERFDAEIDRTRPGAHLDRVAARNALVKRVDRMLRRAIRGPRRELYDRWNAQNPQGPDVTLVP